MTMRFFRWCRVPGRVRATTLAVLLHAAAIIMGGSLQARADHSHAAVGNPATFGAVDFENSCVRSVQTEFRAAAAKLHSFAAEAKDFVEVADKDPSCAIAWWG